MNIKPSRTAIIFGGQGAEHEVSCEGAKYVLGLMREENPDTLPVFIDKSGIWYTEAEVGRATVCYPVRAEDYSGFLSEDWLIPCNVTFPLLHGDFGEDGSVQGALEVAGIPYVGARVGASALSLDKINSKLVAESLGIPTVPWTCLYKDGDPDRAREIAEEKLGYPMFIKPSGAGSSFGAHPVRGPEEFNSAVTDARKFGTGRVLIEKMLSPIRELEVAFFEGATPAVRIVTEPGEVAAGGFYDYREKYLNGSRAKIYAKADIPPSVSAVVREYADALVRGLELRQLGRLDFFLFGEEIYFNEVNTMPGFTRGSLYPKMLEAAGIPPRELISRLLSDAAGRLL